MNGGSGEMVLLLFVCTAVVISGCSGLPAGSDTATSTPQTVEASPNHTSTATPAAETARADDTPAINDTIAVTRALDAEEAYVASILGNASCVDEWGTDPTVMNREGTVENRSVDGVFVAVQQPYWYGTDTDEADGASRVTYLVTENETQRLRGDDISPC